MTQVRASNKVHQVLFGVNSSSYLAIGRTMAQRLQLKPVVRPKGPNSKTTTISKPWICTTYTEEDTKNLKKGLADELNPKSSDYTCNTCNSTKQLFTRVIIHMNTKPNNHATIAIDAEQGASPTSSSPSPSPAHGYIAIIFAVQLYAIEGVLQASLIDLYDQKPMKVIYYRSVVTTALSTLYIVLNPKLRQSVRHLPTKDQGTLFKAGASCVGAVSLAAISLQYSLAGNTSALLNTAFLFVYLITYLQTRMGVTRTDIISILLGLCGILLMLHPTEITLPHLFGFAIGLTAAWCNGLCMIYSKHAAVRMHVILPVLAEESVLLGCCLVSGGMDVRLSEMRERSVATLLVVNGFVVLLAASLVTYGLRFCRPDRAALMLIGEIPMTYLLAWVW